MSHIFYVILWILLTGLLLMSCGITTNFLESDTPKFTGHFCESARVSRWVA